MTQAESTAQFSDWGQPQKSQWTIHLLTLGVFLALFGILNHDIVTAAVTVWFISPTFSHCFLVIPISAYLIWKRHHVLAQMTPVASPRSLVLSLPLIAMLMFGALVRVNEIQQLAFVGLVQVITMAVLGRPVYRKIMFAMLFLFFLVPMGEYLIVPLQLFTTQFISFWLSVGGILHHTDVTTIELANGRFQVAEACAGLRFLIAMGAVGVLFARFYYRKWYKIVIFLAACIIVPIIGNGFRALGVVMLAHESNMKIATGFDHVVYGWMFSVVLISMLMFIGLRFADPISESDLPTPPEPRHKVDHLTFLIVPVLLIISAVPAFLYWEDHRPVAFNRAALTAPQAPAGWLQVPLSGQWQPSYNLPDAHLAFGLRSQASLPEQVDVTVDYYVRGRADHSLVNSTNKLWEEEAWHPLLQNTIPGVIGSHHIQFGQLELGNRGARLVLWTYWINGEFTLSATTVKMDGLRSALGGPQGAALVTVSTAVDSDLDTARARLLQAVAGLGGLTANLRAAANLPPEHH